MAPVWRSAALTAAAAAWVGVLASAQPAAAPPAHSGGGPARAQAFLASADDESAASAELNLRRLLASERNWTVLNNDDSTAFSSASGHFGFFDDTEDAGYTFTSGQALTVEQYRNGLLVWTGLAVMWPNIQYIVGDCLPRTCTASIRRLIGHGAGQWMIGDQIVLPGWHDRTTTTGPGPTPSPPAQAAQDDSSNPTPIVLAILGGIIALLVCLLASYFVYRHVEALNLSKTSGQQRPIVEAQDIGHQSSAPTGPPPHETLYASRWCVTAEQFCAFINEVDRIFPDKDPSIYEVVETIIKPRTRESGTSYALLLNPEGVPVHHFVSNVWSKGIKATGHAIRGANLTGGLWISFLAMPQNMDEESMRQLLGPDPLEGPHSIAINMAKDVIAVRNSKVNIFSRLGCVFELYLASTKNKQIVWVGADPEGNPPKTDLIGMSAVCTKEAETQKLREALEPNRDAVDTWVKEVNTVFM
mmetsp:Transcript_49692/g.142181  ORF Transcript_49692/g.142181 Transcript_49692/m.142181 type:complete len:472 (+) Transcript_49692:82-1497(+)